MNVKDNLGTQRLVRRLNNNTKVPVRGTSGAAGYDRSLAEHVIIPGRSRSAVKTGLAILFNQALALGLLHASYLMLSGSLMWEQVW